MDAITGAISGIIQQAEKNASASHLDYMGEDGLLHCGVCHEPKQAIFEFGGNREIVHSLCRCGAEERDRAEEERREREASGHIQELRINALNKHQRGCRFETAKPTKLIQRCRQYVDAWDEKVLPNNIGLVLWGDCGRGKSYAASCIVNALTDRGIPCLQTSINDLVQRFRGYSNETGMLLDEMQRYKLLVLDDLGTEGNTDFVLSAAFSIVNARINSGLPLIITTNLSEDDFTKSMDDGHRRIFERIKGACVFLLADGENMRVRSAAEKRSIAADIFRA